ncbi:MAG: ABC transporter permease [Dehalococcoidia bacterium]|nr:ABC transporter permease [Dehalococcoidia bacterium]
MLEDVAVKAPAGVVVERKRRQFVTFLVRLIKEKPLGTFGGVIVLLLLLTGILADVLAPYGYNDINPAASFSPPSAKYILGTDNLGRDMLSRIIYGARISMVVGLAASAISVANSTIIGVLCGYIGGKFDLVVQRFVDGWMCFPGLVILIALVSILGPGLITVIVVLGVFGGIGGSRVVRGAVIAIRENAYVEAARAVGCSTGMLLVRHILPNVLAVLIVLFTVRMPGVILTEASLSFLGFGIPPPTPSWGGMLSGTGRSYMFLAPWLAIWPGVALTVVVYGANMFGDALRDLLDPRLRGGLGRYDVKKILRTNAPE